MVAASYAVMAKNFYASAWAEGPTWRLPLSGLSLVHINCLVPFSTSVAKKVEPCRNSSRLCRTAAGETSLYHVVPWSAGRVLMSCDTQWQYNHLPHTVGTSPDQCGGQNMAGSGARRHLVKQTTLATHTHPRRHYIALTYAGLHGQPVRLSW